MDDANGGCLELIRFASVEYGLFPVYGASVCTVMNIGGYVTAVDDCCYV